MDMSNDQIACRYEAAQKIATEAGDLALELFGKRADLTTTVKGVQDFVSEADARVEQLIRNRLASQFPDDDFLGEESGLTEGSQESVSGLWVVDPIDGTAAFLSGIPTWTVSIAYVLHDDVILGVVVQPCTGDIYAASRGAGSWLNGTRLSVSRATTVTEGSVGMPFAHRCKPIDIIPFASNLLEAGGLYFQNGSAALMLAYVAADRLIGAFMPHINSWDCLGGIALVREAGGWTSDFMANNGLYKGNPLVAAGPGVRLDLCRFAGLESLLK